MKNYCPGNFVHQCLAVGVVVGAIFAMAPIEYYDCDWEEDRDEDVHP